MANIISKDEFSSLIQEYASYKRSIQGCSQKTVDEYLLDLRTFFRYLVARENDIPFRSEEFFKLDVKSIGLEALGKIRAEDLYDYLAYVTDDRENQWCARARKLSAIRSLYKYLVNKRHYLEYNPTTDIDSPKAQKTLPKVLTLTESLRLLAAVDNGVKEMNYNIKGLPEWSRNLGVITTEGNEVELTFSSRSAIESRLDASIDELDTLALITGCTAKHYSRYPGWQYAKVSPLRDKYIMAAREVLGVEPKVFAIHAGLECGVIKSHLPDMDIIAIGPEAGKIHTPDEYLDLASFERLFKLVERMLKK
mgnify:CR=1 FL=1